MTGVNTYILTLNNNGGSLNMIIEKIKTKAGAVEKMAVTSVAAILMSALAYI